MAEFKLIHRTAEARNAYVDGYAAGLAAGRAEQKEADAKLCDERRERHDAYLSNHAHYAEDIKTLSEWSTEAEACRDAIRAAAVPDAGAGESAE